MLGAELVEERGGMKHVQMLERASCKYFSREEEV